MLGTNIFLRSAIRNYGHSTFYFSLLGGGGTQQPNLGLGRLFVKVSRSHTIRHTRTHTPGSTPLNERSTRHRSRHLHNKQTSMPSMGFEPAIPSISRLQTYALDCTTTWIGISDVVDLNYVGSRGNSIGIVPMLLAVLLRSLSSIPDSAKRFFVCITNRSPLPHFRKILSVIQELTRANSPTHTDPPI
jgi:hypothetical protein